MSETCFNSSLTPKKDATFFVSSLVNPFLISTGIYVMASGFVAAMSSIFTPPSLEAITTGPFKM